MSKQKNTDDRNQLLIRYKIDEKGCVSFIDPCCDEIPARLFGYVMEAIFNVEKDWNKKLQTTNSEKVQDIIRVGFGKHIALFGYTKSDSVMFPSSAQMKIFDTEDEPFEDCPEAYVDFIRVEQVDDLIEALKKLKESFKNK